MCVRERERSPSSYLDLPTQSLASSSVNRQLLFFSCSSFTDAGTKTMRVHAPRESPKKQRIEKQKKRKNSGRIFAVSREKPHKLKLDDPQFRVIITLSVSIFLLISPLSLSLSRISRLMSTHIQTPRQTHLTPPPPPPHLGHNTDILSPNKNPHPPPPLTHAKRTTPFFISRSVLVSALLLKRY